MEVGHRGDGDPIAGLRRPSLARGWLSLADRATQATADITCTIEADELGARNVGSLDTAVRRALRQERVPVILLKQHRAILDELEGLGLKYLVSALLNSTARHRCWS